MFEFVEINIIQGNPKLDMYLQYSPYSRNNTFHIPHDTYNSYAAKKYPEDIQCVHPSSDPTKGSIYVSNVEAAQNPATLQKHKIRAVMTCAKGYHRNIPQNHIQMFKYFPCEDKSSCRISIYFEEAVNFIKQALTKTNILVHCIAGVSRSVSMVLAYLMKQKGMTYQEAYQKVKSYRSIISPNEGFIRQLKDYESQITVKRSYSVNERRNIHKIQISPLKQQNNFMAVLGSNTKQPMKQEQLLYKYQTPRKGVSPYPKQSLSKTTNTIESPEIRKDPYLESKYSIDSDALNKKIKAIHEKYNKAREQINRKREEIRRDYSMEGRRMQNTEGKLTRGEFLPGRNDPLHYDYARYRNGDRYSRPYQYTFYTPSRRLAF